MALMRKALLLAAGVIVVAVLSGLPTERSIQTLIAVAGLLFLAGFVALSAVVNRKAADADWLKKR